ncbi:MBL fold metallo-hydrolase [Bdellovibrionota bacterium FG-1]
MKYRIHRGANEIGGNLIEVEAQGKKIILDIGMPLTLPEEGPFSSREILSRSVTELVQEKVLPELPGLYDGSPSGIQAVVISHPHIDHYGLSRFVHESIPFYMGEKAATLIRITEEYTPMKTGIRSPHHYTDRHPFEIGPFRITPFLMDHSAFDAYALLIEADDQRLFYSGDFRGHGRKHWCLDSLIRSLPKEIDSFLMEGTMIGRDEKYVTEQELEPLFLDEMKNTSGLVLVQASSQNIDRMVTIYRATLKAGRTLVMDGYTASLFKALNVSSLPQPGWDGVKVYMNRAFLRNALRNRAQDRQIAPLRVHQILAHEISRAPELFTFCFRGSLIRDFDPEWPSGISTKALNGASYIYSLWRGYLPRMTDVTDFLAINEIRGPIHIHCSGHAYLSDLKRLVEAVAPKAIIPIHSFHCDEFDEHFSKVRRVEDGLWTEVK